MKPALSPREKQVHAMIMAGKRATDIAKELGLSVKTVSEFKRRAMQKIRRMAENGST